MSPRFKQTRWRPYLLHTLSGHPLSHPCWMPNAIKTSPVYQIPRPPPYDPWDDWKMPEKRDLVTELYFYRGEKKYYLFHHITPAHPAPPPSSAVGTLHRGGGHHGAASCGTGRQPQAKGRGEQEPGPMRYGLRLAQHSAPGGGRRGARNE